MCKRLSRLVLAVSAAVGVGSGVWWVSVPGASADEPPPPRREGTRETEKTSDQKAPSWTTAVVPKPLSDKVKKGLAWLVENQHPSGGWSQGEESAQMRGGEAFRDTPDVADTCIAALALVRAGNTPREGPYRDAVAKAVRFVRSQVEKSDAKSFSVSDVRGTRVQMKLGPNIDTFLASLFLAEVKGKMPNEEGNTSVDLALNKVLEKIKKNQKADGSWDNQTGWAPILAQSVGGKGLNRAAQAGAKVSSEVLARAESYAVAQSTRTRPDVSVSAVAAAPASPAPAGGLGATAVVTRSAKRRSTEPVALGKSDARTYAYSVGAGSAGVELYDRASSLGVLQDSVNTNAAFEPTLRNRLAQARDPAERDQAKKALERFENTKVACSEAQAALLGRLDDKGFVSGFGSNGGEEFLSYMNISESLVLKGGREWTKWDDAMAANLDRVQNDDGSWSGYHCITGRTFCTAAALLVRMADRTPVPVAARSEGRTSPK